MIGDIETLDRAIKLYQEINEWKDHLGSIDSRTKMVGLRAVDYVNPVADVQLHRKFVTGYDNILSDYKENVKEYIKALESNLDNILK